MNIDHLRNYHACHPSPYPSENIGRGLPQVSPIKIEQRAHDAAMAHLVVLGAQGSDDATNAYQGVYESIIAADMAANIERCGGHQKAVEKAVDMARLHEQGLAAVSMMELRIERNRLKDQIEDSKKNDGVTRWAENLSFAAIGAILGELAMWLK